MTSASRPFACCEQCTARYVSVALDSRAQSRHIAAYATDPELTVNYSGTAVRMELDWPPVLLKIKALVETRLGTTFNVRVSMMLTLTPAALHAQPL